MITSAIAQGLTPIETGTNWFTVGLSFLAIMGVLFLVWYKTNPVQVDAFIAKIRNSFQKK